VPLEHPNSTTRNVVFETIFGKVNNKDPPSWTQPPTERTDVESRVRLAPLTMANDPPTVNEYEGEMERAPPDKIFTEPSTSANASITN